MAYTSEIMLRGAWLTQLVGHAAPSLRVVSLSPTSGVEITTERQEVRGKKKEMYVC